MMISTNHVGVGTKSFEIIFTFLEMTEQEKLIAELGKPRLGERNLIRIHIRESKEFKVINTREKKKKHS